MKGEKKTSLVRWREISSAEITSHNLSSSTKMPRASLKWTIFQYRLVHRGDIEFTPSSLSVYIPILRNNEILKTYHSHSACLPEKEKSVLQSHRQSSKETQRFPALTKLTRSTISSINTPTKKQLYLRSSGTIIVSSKTNDYISWHQDRPTKL